MAEFVGSLFGGGKDQAPVVASDDGMFKFLTLAIQFDGGGVVLLFNSPWILFRASQSGLKLTPH